MILLKYTVTNPGTGTIGGVIINDPLPDDLLTTDGKTVVTFNVGTLEPGQSRTLSVNTKASRTGIYTSTAATTAARGLKAESTTQTIVRKPILTLTQSAPAKQIISRHVTYDITVENTGDAVATDPVLEELISSGSSFVTASEGGQFNVSLVKELSQY